MVSERCCKCGDSVAETHGGHIDILGEYYSFCQKHEAKLRYELCITAFETFKKFMQMQPMYQSDTNNPIDEMR